jgi:hypothetical protein
MSLDETGMSCVVAGASAGAGEGVAVWAKADPPISKAQVVVRSVVLNITISFIRSGYSIQTLKLLLRSKIHCNLPSVTVLLTGEYLSPLPFDKQKARARRAFSIAVFTDDL